MIAAPALCALILALIYLFDGAAKDHPEPRAVVAKTGSVVLLALTGLIAGAPWQVTLGVACCAYGDFAISRPRKYALDAAMTAFALGHLNYAGWMYTPDTATRMFWALPLVLLALTTERWLLPRALGLKPQLRGYIWIITLMAATALTLTAPHRLAIAGAALFVISDLLLALRLFIIRSPSRQRLLSLALWPAYWTGQALILMGSLGFP